MIPGKKYKPEDFLEAAWRRRWVIVVPLVLVSAVTMAVVMRLPDRYQSAAMLVILPQRIPEGYVRSTVTARLDERLATIYQELVSRSRLEPIVQEFDLYPEERRTGGVLMEDVIQKMRTQDIGFDSRNARSDSGSLTISFQYSDPRTAQQVATRLASLVIQENTQDRSVRAEQTDEFLGSQLQDAERQLKEREDRVKEFKRLHPGAMPTEMESNQQSLQSAQVQYQAVQEGTLRDRDRLAQVQRQLNDLTTAAMMGGPPDAGGQSQLPQTYARQLEIAQDVLKNQRLRLKEEHPTIKAIVRQVKDLEQKAAAEALQQPLSGPMSGVSPAEAARASRQAELQQEEKDLKRRIAQRQEEEKSLLAAMSTYRARLDATPNVESQLTDLTRDYTSFQQSYNSLQAKSIEAKLAANLERRNIGETFKLIDSARLPQRPVSPDRYRMNMMGALAGLMIGLGLAGLLEYRDTSLRSDEDVLVALSLPVLASVPTMSTEVERQRRKRHKLWMLCGGAVALLLCVAAVMWKLRGSNWF